MKQSVEIALLLQGFGLAYVAWKGDVGQSLLIGGSMVATYLATREKEAKETLERKGAFAGIDEPTTLDGYVAGLKKARGMAQA